MRFALTGVALATGLLCAAPAWALGLGRITVQSALGESLKAEIDVTSITADEASSLRLRVAPAQAYRAAGVDYNPALAPAQVQVVRRPDGRSVLRVTSDRAVLEPFVDLIIEANWASGRLVREYTMLFDPPGARSAQGAPATAPVISAAPPAATTTPVAPPAVAAAPMSPPAAPAPGPAPAPAPSPAPAPAAVAAARRAAPPAPRAVESAAPRAVRSPARNPAPSSSDGVNQVPVRPGDTLSRIAGRTQRPGVSLDQMLVSLFRANPQAFMGENMNRLKSGSVLTVPAADEAAKATPAEAREVIVAQSNDFDAYRQRLASGTTTRADNAPARQAAGKVQTQVEDRKQSGAPTPDKLTLSRGALQASAADAKVSKDSERKDANARLAELSRNVDELKKLQGATTAPATPSPATAPATAPPATATSPSPAPTPAPTVVAAAPTPTPAPAASPIPAPPAPNPAPTPSANSSPNSSPAAASASALPAPTAVATPPKAKSPAGTPEPGLIDGLSDNPLLLPGAGVLVLLLGGLGLYRLRSKNRKAGGETSFLESRLQPDSFFGASGGQRIDTREGGASSASTSSSSSMSYSLSQLDAIGDVDPVAEADVYLAYGRDLQAEEILKEAMRADPGRMAVRTKLLEVYAKRRDAKGFELLASQLFTLTQGQGEDWAKAQAMGQSIDPTNELYRPGGAPDVVIGAHGQAVEPLSASTMPYTAPVAPPTFQPAADATLSDNVDVDLDLTGDRAASRPAVDDERTRPFAGAGDTVNLTASRYEPAPVEDHALDFDLDETLNNPPTQQLPAAEVVSEDAASDGLDFDLNALPPHSPPAPPAAAASAASAASDGSLDFGDFGRSRDEPAPSILPGDEEALARKLELAEEFRQIGDLEGARDLLEEVVAKSEGVLRSKAQGMLDGLG